MQADLEHLARAGLLVCENETWLVADFAESQGGRTPDQKRTSLRPRKSQK